MDVAAPRCQPSPDAAYAHWLSDCADAGWRAVPAVERIPVREALARVTAEPVRARRASPRAGCAAMDGIAIKAGPAACGAGPADRWQLAASLDRIFLPLQLTTAPSTSGRQDRRKLSGPGSAPR